MKIIKINDLNDKDVDPKDAAVVKGGYLKLGDIKGERRVASERVTLGYTEVEWT